MQAKPASLTGAAFALAAASIVGGLAFNGKPKASAKGDYAAVRASIVDLIDADPNYDDGSKGPLYVRLAWHASGTWDAKSKTGGSNGATMRFAPESAWGANAGLGLARADMEQVKAAHPWISYADLWTLAGTVAIEHMGGPTIDWRAGRVDHVDGAKIVPDGRLPDALLAQDHIRSVFYRMGLNDREIVALIGAHSLGRCHTSRSGFDGPWSRAPTTFSNEYFRVLLEEKWTERKWSGPKQYENPAKDLMMTPSDLAFVQDPEFRKYVELYSKDEKVFYKDFAAAWKRLIEFGVQF
jgi:cytochrome c peroxidase